MTEPQQFFHVCSDGSETRNFISSEDDFKAALNLIGVAAANTGAKVVSFSVEDTHPHLLLYSTQTSCLDFMRLFGSTYSYHTITTRKQGRSVRMELECYPIGNDLSYLRNVAAYTIIQPTKDGKGVMPYDYRWGTGSMYFRPSNHVSIWELDNLGQIVPAIPFGSLPAEAKRAVLHTRKFSIPADWLICDGLILPGNYVSVELFERIFVTHNYFRVFLSNSRDRDAVIQNRIAEARGVSIDDLEARRICGDACKEMFGTRNIRLIDTHKRLQLARNLRKSYRLAYRQLSKLTLIPETELRKYI